MRKTLVKVQSLVAFLIRPSAPGSSACPRSPGRDPLTTVAGPSLASLWNPQAPVEAVVCNLDCLLDIMSHRVKGRVLVLFPAAPAMVFAGWGGDAEQWLWAPAFGADNGFGRFRR